MKIAIRHAAPVVLVILSLISPLEAAEKAKPSANLLSPQAESMTIWQARRALVANLALADPHLSHMTVDSSSCRFTLDSFEFDVLRKENREHFTVDLKTLKPVIAKHSISWNFDRVTDEAGKDLPIPLSQLRFLGHKDLEKREYDNAAITGTFATALNSLRAFANDSESPLRNVTQRAAAWRALPSKPPLPDEVRAQRLLAEEAIKQKNAEEALNRYETGLQLYPTWPQGRFNAALIAAELGFYAEAVEHMQAYLELVPDAQDAQSARDQIVAWQYRVKHPVQAKP